MWKRLLLALALMVMPGVGEAVRLPGVTPAATIGGARYGFPAMPGMGSAYWLPWAPYRHPYAPMDARRPFLAGILPRGCAPAHAPSQVGRLRSLPRPLWWEVRRALRR